MMNRLPFEPVTDTEAFRRAFEMLAIGNVAAHRARAINQSLGIPNHYSIGGRIVSDRDDSGNRVEPQAPAGGNG